MFSPAAHRRFPLPPLNPIAEVLFCAHFLREPRFFFLLTYGIRAHPMALRLWLMFDRPLPLVPLMVSSPSRFPPHCCGTQLKLFLMAMHPAQPVLPSFCRQVRTLFLSRLCATGFFSEFCRPCHGCSRPLVPLFVRPFFFQITIGMPNAFRSFFDICRPLLIPTSPVRRTIDRMVGALKICRSTFS